MDTITGNPVIISPARPAEAGAVGGEGPPQTQNLPGIAGDSTHSAGNVAAINNLKTTQTTQNHLRPPQTKNFARYLVISHADRDKDILKINPTAIQKALTVMIGEDFSCTRYESAKMVEIHVRNKRASEILLGLKELDCTEFKVPVKVTKHKTKNSCKGVIHCSSLGQTHKSQILRDMEKHNVSDIYQLSKTENGVQKPLDSYILTFDSETRPQKIDMGFGEVIKVFTYYPNPRLCRNCQRYGHGQNTCRNKQVCAKCGSEGHAFDDCGRDAPTCFHCKANHSSSSKQCPMFSLEKRVLKQMTDDRSTPLAARKKVYRDSQELVSQVPSLSSYITGAQYSTVAAGPQVISPKTNNRIPQPPPQPPPQTPAQPTLDPSKFFEHPLFKSLVEQQELCRKQQQSMLDEQKQNKGLMETMMTMMMTMMGLMSQMMLPSSQNNVQQFAQQFKQLEKDVNNTKAILNSNNTPNYDSSSSAMETSSSSKISTTAIAASAAKPDSRMGSSAAPSVSDTEGKGEPPKTGSKHCTSLPDKPPHIVEDDRRSRGMVRIPGSRMYRSKSTPRGPPRGQSEKRKADSAEGSHSSSPETGLRGRDSDRKKKKKQFSPKPITAPSN